MTAPLFIDDSQLEWESWDESQRAARGNVIWKTLFSRSKTDTKALTVGIAAVPPGGVLTRHRHKPPEIYYILEGRALVEIDYRTRTVQAGTAIFIPGDAPHEISNPFNADARFLYAFAVDSFDEVTYRFESETASATKNPSS